MAKQTRKYKPKPAKPAAPKKVNPSVRLPKVDVGMNAGALYLEGLRVQIEEDKLATAKQAGEGLRGGSTGLILPTGESTGICVREAAARFLGAEANRDPVEWSYKRLMFEFGYGNEDCWYTGLSKVLPKNRIKREEEFPISWLVTDPVTGEKVPGSGREDIILLTADGKPNVLVELKNDSSLNTAAAILLKREPKLENAVQQANYMLKSGLPGQLWYTNRVVISTPDWGFITPLMPSSVNDTAHHAYPFIKWSQGGKATGINPFLVGYALHWHEGVLHWRPMDAEEDTWYPSVITEEGIDKFGPAVLNMLSSRTLPPRPVVVDMQGARGHYDKCSYCDFQSLCDQVGDNYDEWEGAITELREDALLLEGTLPVKPTT